LLSSPLLSGLARLTIQRPYGFDLGDVADALPALSGLTRLEGLDLFDCRLGSMGLRTIINTSALQGLRHLNLGSTQLTRNETQALKGSGILSGLVSLNVASCGLNAEGLLDLLDGFREGNLHRLVLNHNPIGDQGAQRLASAAHLAGLEALSLSATGMTSAGIEAITSSPNLASLRHLELNGVFGAKRNAEMIAGAAGFAGLTSISLGALDIGAIGEAGDTGLLRLARMPNIRQLVMVRAGITDRGLKMIARSPNLGPLSTLDVGWNEATDEGIVALASAPGLSGLVRLMLNNSQFGGRGARALAESPHLDQLRFLGLVGEHEDLMPIWPREDVWLVPLTRRFGERGTRAYYTTDD
jgi:hypothetical protein